MRSRVRDARVTQHVPIAECHHNSLQHAMPHRAIAKYALLPDGRAHYKPKDANRDTIMQLCTYTCMYVCMCLCADNYKLLVCTKLCKFIICVAAVSQLFSHRVLVLLVKSN